jgi:transcription antitermination protein NusB
MATRREARERALELCYEADIRGSDGGTVLDDLPVPPDAYAAQLVRGVDAHRAELDAEISRYAQRWTIARMPVIDRNLLRIGAYELAHCTDIPTGVVISEAVDLAKAYSTPDSGRFVNGLLARLATVLRPGDPAAPADLDGADADLDRAVLDGPVAPLDAP